MNAVHGTGVDRLLDDRFIFPILVEHAGTAMISLNGKGMGRNVGAVFATNTSHLIHVNPLFPQITP
jgi:hypothetical protein